MFFHQGSHLGAPKVEAILPSEFLNLDCVDHLLNRILKTQYEQIINKMVDQEYNAPYKGDNN